MPVRVIDLLEMIEINEHNGKLISETSRAVNLGLQRLIKMPRVVEAGAVVGDGQFLNLLHRTRIFNRDGGIVAQRLQKERSPDRRNASCPRSPTG